MGQEGFLVKIVHFALEYLALFYSGLGTGIQQLKVSNLIEDLHLDNMDLATSQVEGH